MTIPLTVDSVRDILFCIASNLFIISLIFLHIFLNNVYPKEIICWVEMYHINFFLSQHHNYIT